jgi:hypothetical protein
MDLGDEFLRSHTSAINVSLKLAAELGGGRFDLFRKESPSAILRLLNGVREFDDSRLNVFSDLLYSVFKYKLVERHQRESRVSRLNTDAISRRDLADQPLNVNHSGILKEDRGGQSARTNPAA